MQKIDLAELRRLWEAKESSPSGLDAGLSDAECAWMDAVEQSFPALLDELEAAREELREVQNGAALQVRDRRMKAIGAAEAFDEMRLQADEVGKESGLSYKFCKLFADECIERAAKLRQEAEGK